MKDIKHLILISILATTPVLAEDIFKKIDDNTVQVISTNQKEISIKNLLAQREILVQKMNDDIQNIQGEIDIIDNQLSGAIAAGIDIGVSIESLPSSTVFKKDSTEPSGAGSMTGLNDLVVP